MSKHYCYVQIIEQVCEVVGVPGDEEESFKRENIEQDVEDSIAVFG